MTKKGFFKEEEDADGSIFRYNRKGWFHNTSGPAILWSDGSKWYYVNGNCLSKAEFDKKYLSKGSNMKDVGSWWGSLSKAEKEKIYKNHVKTKKK